MTIFTDPYIDRQTGTLKNLLGITSQDKLSKAESKLTGITIR